MLRLVILCLIVVSMAGCGGDRGFPDAPRADGGELPDGGGLDAGEADGGGLDGGVDGGGADGGGLDGGELDAGDLDAPAATDAPLVSMPCTATGACDPFDVTSCPAGQSCRLGSSGTACMAVASTPARVGEACSRTDGCEPGALCLDFGGGFECHRMCADGSIGSCGAGSVCSGSLGDACVRVCRPLAPACDIYAQDCADPELSCTLVTNFETGERYTGCRPPGTVALGGGCGGGMGSCAEGLVCVRVSGVSTCHAVCNPEAGGPSCAAPATCTGTTTGWGVRYCVSPP